MRYYFIADRKETGYAIAYVTCLKQEIQERGSLTQGWRRLGVAGVEEAVAGPQLGIEKENIYTKMRKEDGETVPTTSSTSPLTPAPLGTFPSPFWVPQEAPPPRLAGPVGLVFLAFSFSINL